MKTYTLIFTATNMQIRIPINAEVIYGKTSLSYKAFVDTEISKWLSSNRLTAKSTKVVDIVLLNESKQIVFGQDDWSDYETIVHKDFDENSNSDLKGLTLSNDFDLDSLE